MKSIKLLMATAMLAIGSTAAMAQASSTDKDGNEYQFKRHWFLDIQAGGQYTVGEACLLYTSLIEECKPSPLYDDICVME